MQVAAPLPHSPFRDDIVKGRVVLITGGATGIGMACAEAFGNHGAKVAIMSRRRDVIDASVRRLRDGGIDAFGTTCDVRDPERCAAAAQEVVDRFGRIDFLINNAAGNFMVSAEQLTPGGFGTVLGIDLQGCFNVSRACLPHMKRTAPRDGGVIVQITATLQDNATPFQLHAASAKAGIDVLTNTLGVEWAEYGIRTVGLAPGGIAGTVGGPGGRVFGNNENKMSDAARVGSAAAAGGEFGEPPPEQVRREGTPAGRWGRVEDVSLAALYVCSPAGGWITATRLTIDGGQTHRVRNYVEMKRAVEEKSRAQKGAFGGKGGVRAKL